MLAGLLLAFVHYRKPRLYQSNNADTAGNADAANRPAAVRLPQPGRRRLIAVCFAIQLMYEDSLVLGAMLRIRRIYDVGLRHQPLATSRKQRRHGRRHQDDADDRLQYDCHAGSRRRDERRPDKYNHIRETSIPTFHPLQYPAVDCLLIAAMVL